MQVQEWDASLPCAQLGMEYLLKENLLEKLLDFVL